MKTKKAFPPPKMKKKKTKKARRSFDRRVVDSTASCADRGADKVKSSADYANPVYLVAPVLSGRRTSSVFMVEAAALANSADAPRARAVAGIHGARRGMSFVAAHSEKGSWILGVGGSGGKTVIYDPSEMRTFKGPELSCPKRQPILLSLDSKVYAISRRPEVYDASKPDFEPWFESLSFRKGVPSNSGEGFQLWKTLPPPPFFPCLLDPFEYLNPPTVSISSYAAAFDSHILLSSDCNGTGTYAFHVVGKTWEKVCNGNLPLVGQAVALGGGLFAACCTVQHDFATVAAVFHMSIKDSSVSANKLTIRLLSLHPIACMGDPPLPLPLLCPTGKGSFCFVTLGHGFHERCYSDRLQIILTAFKIDNIDAVLTTTCQTEYAEAGGTQVQVGLRKHTLHVPFTFKNSRMPVITPLSIDRELAEPFEVERSKKRARKATNV